MAENDPTVGELAGIGMQGGLSPEEVQASFDAEFGEGAGDVFDVTEALYHTPLSELPSYLSSLVGVPSAPEELPAPEVLPDLDIIEEGATDFDAYEDIGPLPDEPVVELEPEPRPRRYQLPEGDPLSFEYPHPADVGVRKTDEGLVIEGDIEDLPTAAKLMEDASRIADVALTLPEPLPDPPPLGPWTTAADWKAGLKSLGKWEEPEPEGSRTFDELMGANVDPRVRDLLVERAELAYSRDVLDAFSSGTSEVVGEAISKTSARPITDILIPKGLEVVPPSGPVDAALMIIGARDPVIVPSTEGVPPVLTPLSLNMFPILDETGRVKIAKDDKGKATPVFDTSGVGVVFGGAGTGSGRDVYLDPSDAARLGYLSEAEAGRIAQAKKDNPEGVDASGMFIEYGDTPFFRVGSWHPQTGFDFSAQGKIKAKLRSSQAKLETLAETAELPQRFKELVRERSAEASKLLEKTGREVGAVTAISEGVQSALVSAEKAYAQTGVPISNQVAQSIATEAARPVIETEFQTEGELRVQNDAERQGYRGYGISDFVDGNPTFRRFQPGVVQRVAESEIRETLGFPKDPFVAYAEEAAKEARDQQQVFEKVPSEDVAAKFKVRPGFTDVYHLMGSMDDALYNKILPNMLEDTQRMSMMRLVAEEMVGGVPSAPIAIPNAMQLAGMSMAAVIETPQELEKSKELLPATSNWILGAVSRDVGAVYALAEALGYGAKYGAETLFFDREDFTDEENAQRDEFVQKWDESLSNFWQLIHEERTVPRQILAQKYGLGGQALGWMLNVTQGIGDMAVGMGDMFATALNFTPTPEKYYNLTEDPYTATTLVRHSEANFNYIREEYAPALIGTAVSLTASLFNPTRWDDFLVDAPIEGITGVHGVLRGSAKLGGSFGGWKIRGLKAKEQGYLYDIEITESVLDSLRPREKHGREGTHLRSILAETNSRLQAVRDGIAKAEKVIEALDRPVVSGVKALSGAVRGTKLEKPARAVGNVVRDIGGFFVTEFYAADDLYTISMLREAGRLDEAQRLFTERFSAQYKAGNIVPFAELDTDGFHAVFKPEETDSPAYGKLDDAGKLEVDQVVLPLYRIVVDMLGRDQFSPEVIREAFGRQDASVEKLVKGKKLTKSQGMAYRQMRGFTIARASWADTVIRNLKSESGVLEGRRTFSKAKGFGRIVAVDFGGVDVVFESDAAPTTYRGMDVRNGRVSTIVDGRASRQAPVRVGDAVAVMLPGEGPSRQGKVTSAQKIHVVVEDSQGRTSVIGFEEAQRQVADGASTSHLGTAALADPEYAESVPHIRAPLDLPTRGIVNATSDALFESLPAKFLEEIDLPPDATPDARNQAIAAFIKDKLGDRDIADFGTISREALAPQSETVSALVNDLLESGSQMSKLLSEGDYAPYREVFSAYIDHIRLSLSERAFKARYAFEAELVATPDLISAYRNLRIQETMHQKGSLSHADLLAAEASFFRSIPKDSPLRDAFRDLRASMGHSRLADRMHRDLSAERPTPRNMDRTAEAVLAAADAYIGRHDPAFIVLEDGRISVMDRHLGVEMQSFTRTDAGLVSEQLNITFAEDPLVQVVQTSESDVAVKVVGKAVAADGSTYRATGMVISKLDPETRALSPEHVFEIRDIVVDGTPDKVILDLSTPDAPVASLLGDPQALPGAFVSFLDSLTTKEGESIRVFPEHASEFVSTAEPSTSARAAAKPDAEPAARPEVEAKPELGTADAIMEAMSAKDTAVVAAIEAGTLPIPPIKKSLWYLYDYSEGIVAGPFKTKREALEAKAGSGESAKDFEVFKGDKPPGRQDAQLGLEGRELGGWSLEAIQVYRGENPKWAKQNPEPPEVVQARADLQAALDAAAKPDAEPAAEPAFTYEGKYDDEGLAQGKGKVTYADGRVYEGKLTDGLPDGKGVLKDAEGNVIAEGLFIDGEFSETPIPGKPSQQASVSILAHDFRNKLTVFTSVIGMLADGGDGVPLVLENFPKEDVLSEVVKAREILSDISEHPALGELSGRAKEHLQSFDDFVEILEAADFSDAESVTAAQEAFYAFYNDAMLADDAVPIEGLNSFLDGLRDIPEYAASRGEVTGTYPAVSLTERISKPDEPVAAADADAPPPGEPPTFGERDLEMGRRPGADITQTFHPEGRIRLDLVEGLNLDLAPAHAKAVLKAIDEIYADDERALTLNAERRQNLWRAPGRLNARTFRGSQEQFVTYRVGQAKLRKALRKWQDGGYQGSLVDVFRQTKLEQKVIQQQTAIANFRFRTRRAPRAVEQRVLAFFRDEAGMAEQFGDGYKSLLAKGDVSLSEYFGRLGDRAEKNKSHRNAFTGIVAEALADPVKYTSLMPDGGLPKPEKTAKKAFQRKPVTEVGKGDSHVKMLYDMDVAEHMTNQTPLMDALGRKLDAAYDEVAKEFTGPDARLAGIRSKRIEEAKKTYSKNAEAFDALTEEQQAAARAKYADELSDHVVSELAMNHADFVSGNTHVIDYKSIFAGTESAAPYVVRDVLAHLFNKARAKDPHIVSKALEAASYAERRMYELFKDLDMEPGKRAELDGSKRLTNLEDADISELGQEDAQVKGRAGGKLSDMTDGGSVDNSGRLFGSIRQVDEPTPAGTGTDPVGGETLPVGQRGQTTSSGAPEDVAAARKAGDEAASEPKTPKSDADLDQEMKDAGREAPDSPPTLEGTIDPEVYFIGSGSVLAAETVGRYIGLDATTGRLTLSRERPPNSAGAYEQGVSGITVGGLTLLEADALNIAVFLEGLFLKTKTDPGIGILDEIFGDNAGAKNRWQSFAKDSPGPVYFLNDIGYALGSRGVKKVLRYMERNNIDASPAEIAQFQTRRSAVLDEMTSEQRDIKIRRESPQEVVAPARISEGAVAAFVPQSLTDAFAKLQDKFALVGIKVEATLPSLLEALNTGSPFMFSSEVLVRKVSQRIVREAKKAGFKTGYRLSRGKNLLKVIISEINAQTKGAAPGSNLRFRLYDTATGRAHLGKDGVPLEFDVRQLFLEEASKDRKFREKVIEQAISFEGERQSRSAALSAARQGLDLLSAIGEIGPQGLTASKLAQGSMSTNPEIRQRALDLYAEGLVEYVLDNGSMPQVLAVLPSKLQSVFAEKAKGRLDPLVLKAAQADLASKVVLPAAAEAFLSLEKHVDLVPNGDAPPIRLPKYPKQGDGVQAGRAWLSPHVASWYKHYVKAVDSQRHISEQVLRTKDFSEDTPFRRLLEAAQTTKPFLTALRAITHSINTMSSMTIRTLSLLKTPTVFGLLGRYSEFRKHLAGENPEGANSRAFDALSRTELPTATVKVDLGYGTQTASTVLFPEFVGRYAADKPLWNPLGWPKRLTTLINYFNDKMKALYGQEDVVFKLDAAVDAFDQFVEMEGQVVATGTESFRVKMGPKQFVRLQMLPASTEGGPVARVLEAQNPKLRGKELTRTQLDDIYARASEWFADSLYVNYNDVSSLPNAIRSNQAAVLFLNPFMSWATRAMLIPGYMLDPYPMFDTTNPAVRRYQAKRYLLSAAKRGAIVGASVAAANRMVDQQEMRALLDPFYGGENRMSLTRVREGGDGTDFVVFANNFAGYTPFGPVSAIADLSVAFLGGVLTGGGLSREDFYSLGEDIDRLQRELGSTSGEARKRKQAELKTERARMRLFTDLARRMEPRETVTSLFNLAAMSRGPGLEIYNTFLDAYLSQGKYADWKREYAWEKFNWEMFGLLLGNHSIGQFVKAFVHEYPSVSEPIVSDESALMDDSSLTARKRLMRAYGSDPEVVESMAEQGRLPAHVGPPVLSYGEHKHSLYSSGRTAYALGRTFGLIPRVYTEGIIKENYKDFFSVLLGSELPQYRQLKKEEAAVGAITGGYTFEGAEGMKKEKQDIDWLTEIMMTSIRPHLRVVPSEEAE